jgi:hypothetical protein
LPPIKNKINNKMKKTLNLFVAALVAVFMVACSGDANGPEKTAEKYLKLLAEGNYDEAGKLGTEDTKQMLNFIKSFSGGAKPEKQNEVKNIKCTVAEGGETAECTYCCNDQGADDKVNLKKVDGNWLVDMKKENPMEGMDMGETGDMGDDATGETAPAEEAPAAE